MLQRSGHVRSGALATASVLMAVSIVAGAPTGSAQGRDEREQRATASRQYFSDTRLIDQDGRQRRFYSDVLAGRTVVLHTFFGDCSGVCPVVLARLREVRQALTSRGLTDVTVVSITVDPERDAPARLKAMADKLDAGPGWLFLSGSAANVHHVLGRLGLDAEAREAHNPTLLVGNVPAGNWTKLAVSAGTDAILGELDRVLEIK